MTADNYASPQRLIVLRNLTTQETYTCNAPSNTIGRRQENDIVLLTDANCSGFHAKIYFTQGDWFVEDLNSTNGTTVNNRLVNGRAAIAVGDTIKIGRTQFQIE